MMMMMMMMKKKKGPMVEGGVVGQPLKGCAEKRDTDLTFHVHVKCMPLYFYQGGRDKYRRESVSGNCKRFFSLRERDNPSPS